jgi:hypothetical protein
MLYYSLGHILEIEDTINGTYNVIERIFKGQLRYDPSIDFDESLHLVYGDQKTVSLICAV